MSLKEQVSNVYSVGLNNVGSYQVSGRPFITGSRCRQIDHTAIAADAEYFVNFPYVTKSFTVWNVSTDSLAKLRVSFASTGSMTNYPANGCFYEIGQNESVTLNLKCNKIYLGAVSGDVQWKVYASLTNIPPQRMYVLTGSGDRDWETDSF